MKPCKGKYSEDQISRSAIMSGEIGKLFEQRVRPIDTCMSLGQDDSIKHTDVYENDLKRFCDDMRQYRLFEHIPHRQVKGLPNFSRAKIIKSPEKLGLHLKDLSCQMDSWRRQSRQGQTRPIQ